MTDYLAMLRARLGQEPVAPHQEEISLRTVTSGPATARPKKKVEQKQAATAKLTKIKVPVAVTDVICLDFECFFDRKSGYTLKNQRLPMESYVRDQRFAAISLGYAYANGAGVKSGWVGCDQIGEFLAGVDWNSTSVLAHNTQFDGLILSHHYGVHQKYYYDTLSMARATYPGEDNSLEALAAKFGFAPKTVPYDRMNGVRPEAMDRALFEEIGEGGAHDCEITDFPPDELEIIDMTVQMFANPRLIGRVQDLGAFAESARLRVEDKLAGLSVTAKDLASSKKFQALLEAAGVVVETKKGRRGPIPCFGKNDDFMTSLLDHKSQYVTGLAEARLVVKSRISVTRALRLAGTAARGPLPVYLKHCGAARTSRWSGGDKANWQNFPRTRRAWEMRGGAGGACPRDRRCIADRMQTGNLL